MLEKCKVLVTGGAGFIGYHLAHRLAQNENHVTIVDNFSRGQLDNAVRELDSLTNVELLDLDLTTGDLAFARQFEYVFHMASINGTANFYSRPFEVTKAAIVPTIRLLEAIRASDSLRKFFLASTSEVYASSVTRDVEKIPTSEDAFISIDDISNPRWSYAAGKIAAESAVMGAIQQFGISAVVARFHNVYGPRMGYDHVIPALFKKFMEGDFRVEGGSSSRSFIYIDDAVDAVLASVVNNFDNGPILHIGTSEEIQIGQLARKILSVLGAEAQLEIVAAPRGSVLRRCPDISKLEAMGFTPGTSLDQGLDLVRKAMAASNATAN